ncbi:MAG: aminoglycoside phosphotransferase family protein [Chloroflexi bacterium]|nr:aminoglycoside phosphotransferase family protein [Chloroflexota bacterium]
MSEIAPEPSAEQFAAIARAIAPGSKVISTCRLTGGISCRMDILKIASAHGETRAVVVRQYGLQHAADDPHPGTIEATVLEHLGVNGIDAPELILGDEATGIMGGPAIVTSFVDGQPNLNPADRDNWVRQLVAAISKVHSLPVDPSHRPLIKSLYSGYDRVFSRSEPPRHVAEHPLGAELWQTLKALWPSVEKPTDCLLHGDYWPGNTLWKNEHLVAIVDWEEPRIGEPTFDIADLIQDAAFFGNDIEQSTVDQYERASGRTLRDYKFWRMTVAMGAMPDPGEWVADLMSMGGEEITPDEVRANLAASVEHMLEIA